MKQWFTPTVGHNSGIKGGEISVIMTGRGRPRVIHREYGTFPEGYVTPPIDTLPLTDNFPLCVGPTVFCAQLEDKMMKPIEYWLGVIGRSKN